MKKFLSLVLALVMTMSLVTVSAGAKDFTDGSEITYKEAVDVISALGVVDGYSDGDFRPDDVLTRGAAAKIICNLILGPTTASALSAGTAPFKDVPVTNTFAGYITYCSQQGIISGYADGTFRPTGTLSGNAFMKMLLGALGYDSSIEGYTGANWQVSVIKQASGIGLDDGNDEFVGSQAVTRQEAALYAFNMLQATMVEYDKKDTIVVGDITINTTSTRKDVENNTNTDGNIDGERNGDGLMQFGEKYFKDLEKEDATDIFGHPSSKWVYDGDDVGTYANEADATYVVEDDDMDVGQVVTSSSYMNYSSSEAKDAKYFLNGDDNEVKSSELVAVGDIVEAYENDNGDVETVVVSRYTVAKIDKVDTDVSTAESRNGASEVLTLTDLDGDNSNDYYDKYDDAEKTLRGYASSYDEGTVLAVAFRDGKFGDEVLASYEAEAVTGEVTAFREDETVTMDGTKYEYSKNYTKAVDEEMKYDLNEAYTVVLDANGYVVYSDASDSTEDYVYVAKLAETGGAKGNLEADAYFIDGTNEVIVVDNDEDFDVKDLDAASGVWYAFDKKSNGKYELTAVKSDDQKTGTPSKDDTITTNGKATVDYGASTVKANNDTIFVVNDDDDITVYTGIKNVPDVTAGSKGANVAVVMDGSYADVVYIGGDDLSVSGDSDDRVYVLESKPDAKVDSDDNKYYEYDAIVNGEITTVKATDKNLKIGLYQNVSYDENGYMDDQDLVKDASDDDFKVYTGIKTISYKSGVLSLGSNDVVLADSYKIFVNDDGDGKTTTPSSLAKNFGVDGTYSENVFVFEDDNDEAVEVYVYKIKDADKNDADKVDAKIDHVQMWADGGFNIVMNQKAEQDTNFTVELQQRVDGKYVSVTTKKVTLEKDATSVSDGDNKFVLESGKVYKVVVNGVESNEVKGA